MKTIYNTYVVMESQEQCDRMKQLCIDNGLLTWEDKNESAFHYFSEYRFFCANSINEFFIRKHIEQEIEIYEQEFIELLKTTKMNPDDYIEGTFDLNNPINQEEIEQKPLTELEEQQIWNQELFEQNKKYKKVIAECIEILEQSSNNTLVINKLKRL